MIISKWAGRWKDLDFLLDMYDVQCQMNNKISSLCEMLKV